MDRQCYFLLQCHTDNLVLYENSKPVSVGKLPVMICMHSVLRKTEKRSTVHENEAWDSFLCISFFDWT